MAGYFLHLPAYDYADDYDCYPREEWDAITITRINIYGWDLQPVLGGSVKKALG